MFKHYYFLYNFFRIGVSEIPLEI